MDISCRILERFRFTDNVSKYAREILLSPPFRISPKTQHEQYGDIVIFFWLPYEIYFFI